MLREQNPRPTSGFQEALCPPGPQLLLRGHGRDRCLRTDSAGQGVCALPDCGLLVSMSRACEPPCVLSMASLLKDTWLRRLRGARVCFSA